MQVPGRVSLCKLQILRVANTTPVLPRGNDIAYFIMNELTPIHFYDDRIQPIFDTPPAREKSPDCPNGFIWNDKSYRVIEMLSSWSDFARRGKMAKNMRPAHATVAASRGSLNVGRFYFRVRTDTNQIFDIYYDRAMKSVDDRKGQWFIYRELKEEV